MLGVWLLIAAALVLAALSLWADRGRVTFLRRRLAEPCPEDLPPATIIVPVKGFDEGLKENLASLAAQDYPDYELIIAARTTADIPHDVLPPTARVAIAHKQDSGQSEKISNLLAAIAAAGDNSKIYAFADSDGRASPRWLLSLAAALREDSAGASTGYRWHMPENAGFWPLMRSAWNAVISGDFGGKEPRFAWGGAMAIRRADFDRFGVAQYWKGSISDDYALTAAVRNASRRIVFAPGAMVVSKDSTGAVEFLGWIRRQMLITRFYAPRLWWLGLIAHLLYCGAMAISVILILCGNCTGVYTLIAQLALGMWKGWNRLAAARVLFPDHRNWLSRWGWFHLAAVPMATWIWLYSFIASAGSSRIRWRGREYTLQTPHYRRPSS